MAGASLVELGEIAKAGGPFDLTAYRDRRAARKGRRIQRRRARNAQLQERAGHGLGRVLSTAVGDAGMEARNQLDAAALEVGEHAQQRGRAIMHDTNKWANRTSAESASAASEAAGKNAVKFGSRLARRGAFWGALGLAGGLGGAAAINNWSRAGASDWQRRRSAQWQPVGKAAPSPAALLRTTDPRKLARLHGKIAARAKAQGNPEWVTSARAGSVQRAKTRPYDGFGRDPQQNAWGRSGLLPSQVGKAFSVKALFPKKKVAQVAARTGGRRPSGPTRDPRFPAMQQRPGGPYAPRPTRPETPQLDVETVNRIDRNRWDAVHGPGSWVKSQRGYVYKADDWKNISQRELEARNGRRAKRQGRTAAGYGGIAMGAGSLYGGMSGVQYVGRNARTGFNAGRLARQGLPAEAKRSVAHPLTLAARQGRAAFSALPGGMKGSTALAGGGLAALAGGAGLYGYGLARERHAESKIRQMRRRRDKVRKSDYSPRELAEFRLASAKALQEQGEDQRRAARNMANVGAGALTFGALGSGGIGRGLRRNYRQMKQMHRDVDELTGARRGPIRSAAHYPVVRGRSAVGAARAFKYAPTRMKISAGLMGGGAAALGLGVWGQSSGRRKEIEGQKRLASLVH